MPETFDAYFEWLGIPPEEQPPHHYRLLGVPLFVDNHSVIEHAADQRMAHLRTLQTGKHSALSQRLLNEVATARVCLLHAEKKAAYDARLRESLQPRTPPSEDSQPQSSPTMANLVAVAQTALPTRVASGGSRGHRLPRKRQNGVAFAAAAVGAVLLLVIVGLMLRGGSGPSGEHAVAVGRDNAGPQHGTKGVAAAEKGPEAVSVGTPDAPGQRPAVASAASPAQPSAEAPSAPPITGTAERAASEAAQPAAKSESKVVARPAEPATPAPPAPAAADAGVQSPMANLPRQQATTQALPPPKVSVPDKAALASAHTLAQEDLWEMKAGALSSSSKQARKPAERREFAQEVLALMKQALDADAFEAAGQMAKLALAEGTNLHDRQIISEANEGAKQAKLVAPAFAAVKAALATLKQIPDDPEANLNLGRYQCFVKGEWPKGLACLVKGSDTALKALAGKEQLAASGRAPAVSPLELGEAWWDLAQQADDAYKEGMLLRAGYWYEQSLDGSEAEVSRSKVAKRLEAIAKLGRGRNSGQHLVFKFNDRAFAEKYWEWNGEWTMAADGGNAPKGPQSFLRTRHSYAGNVWISMDFNFGRAFYTNTGGCWITVWGKKLKISDGSKAVRAQVLIHRGGDKIVYVLNGETQRIPVEPEVWSKPTVIELHWRSRSSQFRQVEIKAQEMFPAKAE